LPRRGESGAGKTFNAGQLLSQLARLLSDTPANSHAGLQGPARLALRLPSLLAPFVCCTTALNNNASRAHLGYTLQLCLGGPGQRSQLAGLALRMLLPDVWRLTSCAAGETPFQVFQDLLQGADAPELTDLQLHRNFRSLCTTGVPPSDEAKHAASYKALVQGLLEFGASGEESQALVRIVAGILHLGALEFGAESDIDGIVILHRESLPAAATLLALEPNQLEQYLTYTIRETRGEQIKRFNTAEAAVAARNLLLQESYARLLHGLVALVNRHSLPPATVGATVTVVDPSGFEVAGPCHVAMLANNIMAEALQARIWMICGKRTAGSNRGTGNMPAPRIFLSALDRLASFFPSLKLT
jgi:myosin-5